MICWTPLSAAGQFTCYVKPLLFSFSRLTLHPNRTLRIRPFLLLVNGNPSSHDEAQERHLSIAAFDNFDIKMPSTALYIY